MRSGKWRRQGGISSGATQIDTFTDAHAGVAEQQQGIAGEIVAALQLLLDSLVLFWSQRPREAAVHARNIVVTEQMSKRWELMGPG